jgi:hypothetical protein
VTWGIGLGVLFGLTYTAYYTATYFAVRQQATDFADRWLNDLRAGKVEQAYLRTMEVSKRPREDANLRASLENLGAANQLSYHVFQQAEFVRLLKQGGPEAQVNLTGVKDWDYEKGGYQVQLVYQIGTPIARFELTLGVQGKESMTGEYEGRQWNVMMDRSQADRSLITFTHEGERVLTAVVKGRQLAQNWLEALGRGDKEEAYRETLPPAERAQEGGKDKAAPGKKAFLEGGLVRADPKTFWATEPKQVVEGIKDIFRTPGAPMARMELANVRMPEWDHVDGKLRGRYDVGIGLFDRGAASPGREMPAPKFQVDAMVVVESTAPAGQEDKNSWRVLSLELIRGGPPGPEAAMAAARRGMRPPR